MGYMKKGQEKNKVILGYSGYSGFSLVELMIVVAIIGVLTAIAIPNFQSFQARSRRSSAKAALSGIYTAAQTFHSKWEVYAGSLAVIGYSPTGDYRYLVGFASTGDTNKFCGTKEIKSTGADELGCGPAPQRKFTPKPSTNDIACANVNDICAGGHSYLGDSGLDAATYFTSSSAEGSGKIASKLLTTEVAVNTFYAGATGDPRGFGDIANNLDIWGIDETKLLENKIYGSKYKELF